jgi:Nif-specific regulatory protein
MESTTIRREHRVETLKTHRDATAKDVVNLVPLHPGAARGGGHEVRAAGGPSLPEHLAALATIGEELAAATTLSEGFERAMSMLDARLAARRSAVLVTEGRQLTVEVAYGMPRDALRPRYGMGVAGRVAETGQPIVIPSVRREPMALAELSEPAAWRDESLSLVAVPLSVGGRCVGALSVYFVSDPSLGFRNRLNVVQVVASALAQGLRSGHAFASATARAEPPARMVFEYANMIGASAPIRQVYEEIGQVARTSATALILGESGTGKELVAQAIHANSDRADKPFIKINSAAFPETLFESELFGHERGAFTGAVGRKKGRLDRAQGGTLFLDEIGDLPLSTQVKLLRVLQSREYERLGGAETLKADVRFIAATNNDVAAAVAAGTFREDLYYRLNVFTITLPRLRDRRADVPALAQYFLEKFAREHRRDVRRISSGALDLLTAYPWPGNVRELENAIERAVVSCDGAVVDEPHLPETVRGRPRPAATERATLAQAVGELERRMIEDALRECNGNLARASRRLGTTERILRYKIGKYALGGLRTRTP